MSRHPLPFVEDEQLASAIQYILSQNPAPIISVLDGDVTLPVSSTTAASISNPVASTAFQLPLAAATRYFIDGEIIYDADVGVDLKMLLVASPNLVASGRWTVEAPGVSITNIADSASFHQVVPFNSGTAALGGGGVGVYARARLGPTIVTTGGISGAQFLVPYFAQNTSNAATVTIHGGAYTFLRAIAF